MTMNKCQYQFENLRIRVTVNNFSIMKRCHRSYLGTLTKSKLSISALSAEGAKLSPA